MENPIILFLYWFENFCLILMGGVIFNYFSPYQIKNFAQIAFYNAISLYVIRNLFSILNLPINLHTFINIIIFIVLLKKFGNISWLLAFLTGIFGYIAVIFNEMTMVYNYIKWFNIPVNQIATNVYLHLGLGLLADMTFVVIIVLSMIARKLQMI